MAKFTKKRVTVEAITFQELVDHGRRVAPESINGGMPWSFTYAGHHISHENDTCYLIPTLEGTMKMGREDMLITGVKGEIYPCKQDIFDATYEAEADAIANESSHDFRHSSSYGGKLCANCGAVKGSRRGGLECSDPHSAAPDTMLPMAATGPDSLEREIQAKANNGPRVTPADIEAEIVSEHYFTGADGVRGDDWDKYLNSEVCLDDNNPLHLLTICVLVLRNGFTVIGHSACASPENFNAEIGRRIARENAEREIWKLLGFRLRDQLSAA